MNEDKVVVRDELVKSICVQGPRAVEAMRELRRRLELTEFYATPSLPLPEKKKDVDSGRAT